MGGGEYDGASRKLLKGRASSESSLEREAWAEEEGCEE